MSHTTPERIIATVFGLGLILTTLIVALIFGAPIQVLRDWHLQTDANSYHPNDTIELQSTSVKLRDATGKVNRVIECDSGKDSTVQYALNLSMAKRPPGANTSVYGLKIPSNVVDIPVTCRVVITVTYRVYWIRDITESTVSNNFVVK